MADSIALTLARLQTKIELCHDRHPNTCLVVWSAGSFQVAEFILRFIIQAVGLPWHPLLPL